MKNKILLRNSAFLFVVFLLATILISCDKFRTGKIKHKVKYTTVELKQKKADTDSTFSHLGDLVTTITPTYLLGEIRMLMLLDHWDQWGSNTHMFQYQDGTYLAVDFSDNEEVEYTPVLHSSDMKNDIFDIDQVTLNYIFFNPSQFIQRFEIPYQYGDIDIIEYGNRTFYVDSITGKRIIEINSNDLIWKAFENQKGIPKFFIIGNTDSTFLVNEEGIYMNASENYPIAGDQCIARSSAFQPVTVKMPNPGQTIEMYSTISFNSENLIQVYAGVDKIPYTQDDIFVYAPKYWERLKVKLEVN